MTREYICKGNRPVTGDHGGRCEGEARPCTPVASCRAVSPKHPNRNLSLRVLACPEIVRSYCTHHVIGRIRRQQVKIHLLQGLAPRSIDSARFREILPWTGPNDGRLIFWPGSREWFHLRETMGILEKQVAIVTDSRMTSSYIEVMHLDAIVQSFDDELDRILRARPLLTAHTAPWKRGFPPSEQDSPTRKRRKMGRTHPAHILQSASDRGCSEVATSDG